jgi:tRNA threonylcarbamoyladenosine biosynthesis protein TsaB
MALRLAIEISNPSSWEPGDPMPGIAVGDVTPAGCVLLGTEAIDPTRQHDDDLMPAIQRLCGRIGAGPPQLRSVAVSIGPGGFTATRLAVTTAKCLAAVVGAECIAVPSAAVAVQSAAKEAGLGSGHVLVVMAAKGQSVFCQRWRRDGHAADDGRALDAAALDFQNAGLLLADRFAQAAIASRHAEIADRGILVWRPIFTPQALLEASLGVAATEATRLLPLYPREPEAVTKWRALKAAGKK